MTAHPSSPDAQCRDEIAERCGSARLYLGLAIGHAEIGDDAGLSYDLRAARLHFVTALGALKDMEERRAKAVHVQQMSDADVAREFA